MGKEMNILYFFFNYFLFTEMNVLLLKGNREFVLFLFSLNHLRQTLKWFSVHGPQFPGYNSEIQFQVPRHCMRARKQAYSSEQNTSTSTDFCCL